MAASLSQIVTNVFFHPLSKVPGPLLAKFTTYYIILLDLVGNRTTTIHSLHEKFGPVVRVGPDELSFSEPSIVKELYGQGTPYLKAKWYDYFNWKPGGIFSIRPRKESATRRKLLSHAFSQSAFLAAEGSVHDLISKLVKRLEQRSGKSVDALQEFRRLSLDVIGQLFMGQSFHALDDGRAPEYLTWLDHAFPPIKVLLPYLPFATAKDLVAAPELLKEHGRRAYFEYIEKHGRTSNRKDLLTKVLSATSKKADDQAMLTDEEAYSEVGNMIFAATGLYTQYQDLRY